jgi:hypothetical protein
MKALHASKQGATDAPHEWRQRRQIRILLTAAANRYRTRPGDREKFQDAAPIGPDWRTYRAFISYHVRESADWPAIERLLLEMRRDYQIPLTREIYTALFRGFARHGGIISAWNQRNLEVVWREFEKSLERRPGEFGFEEGMCLAAVKAFLGCAGRKRTREVWDVLRERWELGNTDMEVRELRLLGRGHQNWDGG